MSEHVTINGVHWPMAVDSVEEEPDEVGEVLTRSLNGRAVGTRIERKRRWRGRSVFHVAAEGEAWRRFVEADGQAWDFLSPNAASSKGVGPSSGGFAVAATDGVHGLGKVTPGSGNFFGINLQRRLGVPGGWSPATGWTLLFFKRLSVGDGGDGVTYVHHVVAGSVAVNRGVSANPVGVQQWRNGVAGSYGVGNWLSVGTTTTALWSFSDAATAAAYAYSGLVVLPFVVPAAWVPGLTAFHISQTWPGVARVRLGGDVVVDAGGPVDAIARVRKLPQRSLMLAGERRNNARVLELELMEA
jgi:hypothetical protein